MRDAMKWKLGAVLLCATFAADASSLRFFGNGVNDIDRVKVRIDNPADANPGPPADVGATDFTIEFWMRAASGNDAGTVSCGANVDWILGNVIIDRDRFAQDRKFGISMAGGRIVFGVSGAGTGDRTICGTTDLRDSQWHHVAVQRRRSDGFMWLYVDGQQQASANGPDGDISYPDDGIPGSFCGGPCTDSDPFLVFAAEKHDVGSTYPSFSGWLDEIRLSAVLRYSANFSPPTAPFTADASTAALYRFDEGAGDFIGDSAFGGASPGVRRYGGSPAGPEWSTASPFTQSPGVLALSAATYAVAEGTATLSVPVRRSGGTSGSASVTVTVSSGTATAGADYTVTSPVTLSWSDGDAADKNVTITIVNDVQPESSETFQIALSNAVGASLGSPSSATATISDNDAAQPGTLRLASAAVSVGEGAGAVTLTVERVNGTDGAVSVGYATANGSAVAGSDYTAIGGTLNFAAGQASATIQVPVADDVLVEGSETFTVTLSNAAGGALLGSPAVATVTIADNDTAQPGTLRFTAASASVNVGEGAGTLLLTVERVSGTDGAVSVNYATANDTAVAGSDYTARSGTLDFAAGQATATVQLPIVEDTAVEGNEAFTLTLSNPTGGATLGTPLTATVTIVDDDAAPPPQPGTLRFTSSAVSVGEAAGTLSVTVERVSGTDGAVSVTYATANGTATAGTDYTARSGTLNFAAGQATATIDAPIVDDTGDEPAETFTITLSAPAGGAALGSPAEVTVTINDNDVSSPPPPSGGGGGGGAVGWPSLAMLFLAGIAGSRRRYLKSSGAIWCRDSSL
jgi:hypothetical protein